MLPGVGLTTGTETPARQRAWLVVFLAGLLPALIRVPFWVEALRLAPDGDTSIVGLMAQHGRDAATFWGQPYGSPLDAWLAAPFIAWLGPCTAAVRWPSFLLGLLLAPFAAALAGHLERSARAPAALLLACPPAYFLLLGALPPPFYPSLLALEGALLLGVVELARRLPKTTVTRWTNAAVTCAALGWGLLAGLALWSHLLAAAFVGPAVLWLAWRALATWRGAGDTRAHVGWHLAGLLGALTLGLLVGSAPWWRRLAHDPSAISVLSLQAPGMGWSHLRALAPRLHEPLLGLLGAHVPTTADDPVHRVGLTTFGIAVLVLIHASALAAAWRALRRPADREAQAPPAATRHVAWLLAGVVLTTLVAFPWPLRAGPETLRFLTPAYLPWAVLVAFGASHGPRPRRAWLTLLPLVALHLQPAQALLATWRQAGTSGPPLLPDCRPLLGHLRQAGISHVWASYDTAWCLTYLGAGQVVASQPWNERFPDWPLPYVGELRRAANPAWILIPGVDFDLPDNAHFERRLGDLGATFQHAAVGAAHVYSGIRAPFTHGAASPGIPTGLGDGDLRTRVLEPGRGASTWTLPGPRQLAALTLLGALDAPGLPDGLSLEVSPDGQRFERVARLRSGAATREPIWFDRQLQPRAGLGALTVALRGRTVLAVRLTPLPPVPALGIAELLVHPTDDTSTPPEHAARLPSAWLEKRTAPTAPR